jgi:hypothetical protein
MIQKMLIGVPMKKNLKSAVVVFALLIPSMLAYQVQAKAQSFSLTVAVASTRTLASNSTPVVSASTAAGGTTTTSLGTYSVALVAYTSPYTVTVAMTQLTATGGSIPFTAMTYLPGTILWTTPGTSAATASNQAFSSTSAVTPISVTTSDASTTSMSWIPQLSVIVPGGQAIGIYTATITHSLS